MKKRNFSLDKLIYNNKYVMLISFILAVSIWLFVAIQFSPPEERVIKDIPVKIDMSQSIDSFDLQIFGTSDFTIDVTVTGKRYVVAQTVLTSDDIVVTANTNYVDSAGKYSLKLDVKKKNQQADYEITKVSEDNIEVYFDTYSEREFSLIPEVISSGSIIPEGYYKDAEILSAKTVKVSGPTTEMNRIDKVLARVIVDKEITTTKTEQAEIIVLGEYSSILRYLTINNGNTDITMTIPVYKIIEMPVAVTYKNIPASFIDNPLQYTCTPKKALFGIEESILETIKEVSISTIDFNMIKAGRTEIVVQSSTLKQYKVLDDTSEFKITINAANFSEKKISVPQSNITLVNLNSENTASLRSGGLSGITIVGQQTVLDSISAADVYAEVDFGNEVLQKGNITKPVRVYLKGYDNCWVYGQYSLPVIIS